MHWVTAPGTSHPEEVRITTETSKELRAIPGVRNLQTLARVQEVVEGYPGSAATSRPTSRSASARS